MTIKFSIIFLQISPDNAIKFKLIDINLTKINHFLLKLNKNFM